MKKSIVILASLVLLAGVSFAQDKAVTKTEAKADKKEAKADKKEAKKEAPADKK